MNTPEVIELKNIDPEDISDVLAKIEKSFGFSFGKNELADTKTFGDLCDIISSRITLELSDECTTQLVFYKIRQAIVKTQLLEKNAIIPDSELEGLFPKKDRRLLILQIEKELGFYIENIKTQEVGKQYSPFDPSWFFGRIIHKLAVRAHWRLPISHRLSDCRLV